MWSFEELPKPVAFVLSGGVALGAVQAGMLRAVQAFGIKPDFLVGSSVGALNAAFIGQGFTEARVKKLTEIWGEIKRSDIFGRFGLRRIVNIISEPTALASPKPLLHLIATHLPASYASMEIPTHIVATDFLSGDTVILSQGNLSILYGKVKG